MKNKIIRVLATVGLIVAIFLILKGVFDIGKIGIKGFSKLPILKCEINDTNGSKNTKFYDLEKIKNENPLNGLNSDEKKEYLNRQNLEATTFLNNENMDQYTIMYRNHDNGISKGWQATIKKDTGEIRISFPKHTPVNASFDDVLTAYAEAQNFNGVCSEVKRKNL